MAKKSVKSSIKKEVTSAKKWTKTYLEYIFEAIEEGNFEEAVKWSTQLGPLWGQIEVTLSELTGVESY